MAIIANGTSTYIHTGNDPFTSANLDVGSMEFWIRVQDTPSGDEFIIDLEGWVVVKIDSSRQIKAFSDGSGSFKVTSSAIPLNEWVLVEFNWTTTSDCDLYINGTNTDGSAPDAAPGLDGTTGRRMGYGGERTGASTFTDGDLGPLRISDIRRNTTGYTAPAPGFWVDDANALLIWNLNEMSGTVAGDQSGNSKTGTVVSGSWVSFPDIGATENGRSLDLELSSSQYASITDAAQTGLDLSGDFTIEFWAKVESAPGSNVTYHIINKSDYGANQRSYLIGYQDVAGTKKITAQITSDGTSTNRDRITWATTLTAGTWYHIAVVCDISNAASTEFVLYLNGMSQGNGTVDQDGSVTAIHNGTADFVIGATESSGTKEQFFDGLIDEVRIWNDIRTATEIHDNIFKDVTAEAGLQGYWKLNDDYLDETANNNDLTASGSPVFSTDVAFPEYRALNPVALASTDLGGDANLVAYYKLEDVNDETANNYDLTNNNTVAFNTAKFNNGADYGSANTDKSLSRADSLGIAGEGNFSISMWVKLSAQPTSGNFIGFFGLYSTLTLDRYIRPYYQNNSGTYRIQIEASAGTNGIYNVELGTSIYHHVVFTRSGTTTSLYLNGIFVVSGTQGIGTSATSHFTIGRYDTSNSGPFTGIQDDVAVFTKVLTADEIFDLYTGVSAGGVPLRTLMGAGT